jgi:hypothetical protein
MLRNRILPHLGVLALATLAACGGATVGAPQATATSAPRTEAATPQASTPSGPTKFTAKISNVTPAQLKYSWRPGCPVSYRKLRMITMTYWGFDKKAHTGNLVVHQSAANDLISVFRRLYGFRYPITRMEPVDKYKGDDSASIDVDNTSAFNCRAATGSTHWSQHAYGLAVDIDPRENPYVNADGTNEHRNADQFVTRPLHKPGVVNAGDRVVKAFAAIGWGWGGTWPGAKDYQHFSSTGG